MFVLQRFCFICDITLSVKLVTSEVCVITHYSRVVLLGSSVLWFYFDVCMNKVDIYGHLECFLSFESLK